MGFFKKLGFRPADEMERHIFAVATRISWIAMTLALMVGSVYDLATQGTLTASFMILMMGQAIYFGTMLYMRKKLTGDHQEQGA